MALSKRRIFHEQQAGWRAGLLCTLLCATASSGVAEVIEVSIADYRFQPASAHLRVGDTVRWINREKRSSHSVLLIASGQESERIFPGESWEKTFTQAGRLTYRCGPHPEMEGVLDVE